MLWTLIEKEIRNNLLNMRFVVAFFATTVLVVGSSAFIIADYVTTSDEYDQSHNLYSANRSSFDSFLPYYGANHIARRPHVLSIFAMGAERSPNDRATISWVFSPQFRSSLRRSPLPMVFAPVDLAFIVGVVMSLLVFMLTFDAVSGEREQGVLRLLLASPVPRDTVILGKWLGGYISLIMPFLPSVVLVLLVLLFTPQVDLTAGHWLRIGGIIATLLLYLATVFSLSMLVSCLHTRSGTVALSLLVVWVLMALVVPGLSVQAAQVMYAPTGVRTREVDALSKHTDATCPGEDARDKARQKRWEELHGGRNWPDLSREERDNWSRWVFEQGRILERRGLDSILYITGAIADDELSVARKARWLGRISPFSCMQNACIALAATGPEHERRLTTSLIEHCRNNHTWYRGVLDEFAGHDELMKYSNAPRYQQPPDRVDVAGGMLLLDTGILALMGLLFFLAAYWRFVRMNV